VAQLIDSHGIGFEITPETSNPGNSGSFLGGSGETKAYVDGASIFALAAGPASFDSPDPLSTICQATLSKKFTAATVGASDAVALKLKKPKGLKAITIGPGSLDNSPSTLTSHVP